MVLCVDELNLMGGSSPLIQWEDGAFQTTDRGVHPPASPKTQLPGCAACVLKDFAGCLFVAPSVTAWVHTAFLELSADRSYHRPGYTSACDPIRTTRIQGVDLLTAAVVHHGRTPRLMS